MPDTFVNSRDAPACVRFVSAITEGRAIEGVFGPWDRSNLGPGAVAYGVDSETIHRCRDLARTERIVLSWFLDGLHNLESFQPGPMSEADKGAVRHVIEAVRQMTDGTEYAASAMSTRSFTRYAASVARAASRTALAAADRTSAATPAAVRADLLRRS